MNAIAGIVIARRLLLLAGGASRPDDVSGLVQWLRADSQLYTTSGGSTPATADTDPVGRWEDLSGNGLDMTQAASGNRPEIATGSINGHPSVRFGGAGSFSASWLSGGDISSLTAGEAFVVVKIDADPPAFDQSGLWSYGLKSGAAHDHYPYTDGNIYETFGSTSRLNFGNPSASLADWRTYNTRAGSATLAGYIDATLVGSGGVSATAFPTAIELGRTYDQVFAQFLQGNIAELILYNRILSTGDRAIITGYINDRYGI